MTIECAVEQLPADQVAEMTSLHAGILRMLVRYGALPGVVQPTTQIAMCDVEAAQAIAAQLAAAHAPVAGQGIAALAAAAKYRFADDSIYKWRRDGWVKLASTTVAGNRLFTEGDIAMARVRADLVGHVASRSVFPSKPRPGRPRKKP